MYFKPYCICYFFSEDFTASQTSKKLKISRQTINTYYKIFRELLFNELFLIKNNQNLAISDIMHISEYSDSNVGVQPDTFAMRFSSL